MKSSVRSYMPKRVTGSEPPGAGKPSLPALTPRAFIKFVALLAEDYPASVHVRDVGLSSSDDQLAWSFAAQSGFVIVSKDSDFQQRAFHYDHPPKII
ncbi:DUF5615 family PIN-like protein [Sorangium sp. So ce118]